MPVSALQMELYTLQWWRKVMGAYMHGPRLIVHMTFVTKRAMSLLRRSAGELFLYVASFGLQSEVKLRAQKAMTASKRE